MFARYKNYEELRSSLLRDANIIGFICLIVLCISLAIEKAIALEESLSHKHPKATAFICFLLVLAIMGLLGKSDMDAEIAYYGN